MHRDRRLPERRPDGRPLRGGPSHRSPLHGLRVSDRDGHRGLDQDPRQVLGVSNTVVFPAFNRADASRRRRRAGALNADDRPGDPARVLGHRRHLPGARAPCADGGLGRDRPGRPGPAGTALGGHRPVQSSRYCEAHTRVYTPGEELCTLDTPARRAVACFGDSGGPLLATLPTTGEVVELGIASHLYTDCEPTSPSSTRAPTWSARGWRIRISSAQYLPGTVTPASTGRTVAGVARQPRPSPGSTAPTSPPARRSRCTWPATGNGSPGWPPRRPFRVAAG